MDFKILRIYLNMEYGIIIISKNFLNVWWQIEEKIFNNKENF